MLRGLYIAGTGMLTQMSRMNVLTNNIANAQTTGFKADQMLTRSFKDMMIERINDPAVVNTTNEVGPLNTGIHIDEIYTAFEQGAIEQTGLGTDLAIEGDAFFTVQTPDGIRYTRAGNFTVNKQGYLVTSEGNQVLGKNGPVHVGTGAFSVDATGVVEAGGKRIDQLRMAAFADNSGLRKAGSNLFTNYTNQPELEATGYSVVQNSLENSNVEVVDEIVRMMTVQRAYETNQKVIQITDETFARAVNDIGQI
ncbi:MAG: flagellar basal-body rod protein FlgF [Bacillota bacterium]